MGFLRRTYGWSVATDIDQLARAVSASASLPLVATGSGGSFTAAHFAAFLHQTYTGKVSKAVTPLELASFPPNPGEFAALFLSAGGTNTDINSAFAKIVKLEPRRLIVVCFRPDSPLVRKAAQYRYVDRISYKLPSGRDGFLATNSLLAASVLLYRAYAQAIFVGTEISRRLRSPLDSKEALSSFVSLLRRKCLSLWERDTLLVLHGPSTHSAALDLESKFTEAALGAVLVSDYRNFAHGRHHWLAKRGGTSAVVAFVAEEDGKLAERTLGLIPGDVPIVRIDIPDRAERAHLMAILYVFHMVQLAGEARGIDPGRPGVPLFGRRLYNLRPSSLAAKAERLYRIAEDAAIARKLRTHALISHQAIQRYRKRYRNFVKELRTVSFVGLISDYDGTLCDERDRYRGMSKEVAAELSKLLRAGVIIAIATGRGQSVKHDLRRKIKRSHWGQVTIGYYNGAQTAPLSSDVHPDGSEDVCGELIPLRKSLQSNPTLNSLATCTYRRTQITIEPGSTAAMPRVWEIIHHVAHDSDVKGIRILRSAHSIDVLAPGVSKVRVFECLKQMYSRISPLNVLCVGDLGRWPGNDCDLLQFPFSLSVDEVSQDHRTCWNLAPSGHRGVQATLDYLRSIRVSRPGCFRVCVQDLLRTKP